MAKTTSLELPTLALPHPLVLLPSARVAVPITATVAEALIRLADSAAENGQTPVVAAVPLLPPQQPKKNSEKLHTPKLNEWGVVARVVRLVRPPTRSSSQPHLLALQGLSRVRLLDVEAASASFSKRDPIPLLAYERASLLSPPNSGALIRTGGDGYGDGQDDGERPSKEEFISFKNAALRMLERLSQDTTQSRKREAWVKIMGLVEDLEEERAGWMADMLVSTVGVEYADKIGMCSLHLVEVFRDRKFVAHSDLMGHMLQLYSIH